MLAVNGATTVTVRLDLASTPRESVVVTDTVNDPANEYVWATGEPVPVEPSTKTQLKGNGPPPPVVVAVNVTAEVASGPPGLKLKLTAGAEATLIVWLDVVWTP